MEGTSSGSLHSSLRTACYVIVAPFAGTDMQASGLGEVGARDGTDVSLSFQAGEIGIAIAQELLVDVPIVLAQERGGALNA